MLCQKLIFIHPFLPPRRQSIAIVTPKKTVNIPKRLKCSYLYPPILLLNLVYFYVFLLSLSYLSCQNTERPKKPHCQDKANQINKPMKFFPNITNKSRYKRCCYKILGDIQAIITNFLPHASPPILLQSCRYHGGFCLPDHNPDHIPR